MVGLAFAVVAGYGMFLLFTASVLGWSGYGVGPRVGATSRRRGRVREFMVQAGLSDVRLPELVAIVAVLTVTGGAAGYILLGTAAAPFAALAAGAAPFAAARARRDARRAAAAEAWPRMIEEVRLQTTTMGRSIPQALLDVGLRGPEGLRPAFAAAHREWLISTDFARTVAVLKDRLADPTADAVCETLLIAHEIGGSDVDARLAALIEDRVQDLQGRKDARSKQAGAKFARLFVLIVPVGMALAGWTIADGRSAYETTGGRLGVATGVLLMLGCWVWAGRIMRLPAEERVFFR